MVDSSKQDPNSLLDDEAIKLLREGGAYIGWDRTRNKPHWVQWEYDEETNKPTGPFKVTLDGDFTLEELQALIRFHPSIRN